MHPGQSTVDEGKCFSSAYSCQSLVQVFFLYILDLRCLLYSASVVAQLSLGEQDKMAGGWDGAGQSEEDKMEGGGWVALGCTLVEETWRRDGMMGGEEECSTTCCCWTWHTEPASAEGAL